jgi:hypothetical protein
VTEFDKLELVIVRDEAEAVLGEIAADLRGRREMSETFARPLDFDRSTLRALIRYRRDLTFLGDWKETAVGETRSS